MVDKTAQKQRLLIVEDEASIRTGLVDVFVYHGYDVEYAEDGTTAVQKALDNAFDLVLLDIMLPGISGYDVCERLRRERPELAIIMLTARASDEDVVHGLKLGADDYVAKPFAIEQLVLRVAAVLRRTTATTPAPDVPDAFSVGSMQIDTRMLEGRSTSAANPVPFTRREMDVLVYLHLHSDRPVPREELLANVWGYKNETLLETRTVDIHIAKLRRKIEPEPKTPRYLLTIRGAGYRLPGP